MMISSSILFVAISVFGQQKVDPALLVGVWEVVKADSTPVGSTLELGSDGKFLSMPKDNGSGYPGTYTVKDDRMTVAPAGLTITIKELTPTRLVLDGLGGVSEYKRKGASAGAAMPKGVQRSGGFSFGAQPKAGAVGKWIVVTSKADGFSVDMPGQPYGRENGSGGGFEVHGLSYQSQSLELIVNAIHGPTEVPEAELPKALESLRTKSVSRYGKDVKLVSEKSIQLGEVAGQEFEVTLDRLGSGMMNIKGRAFLKGKTAYVLLAIPTTKGQAIPPDAQKFFDSFAIGDRAEAGPALAKAGVPKGASRKAGASKAEANPRPTWGKEVDPDGDVKIMASGRSLKMQIPGKAHVLAPERDKMNAPRVVAPVVGDFVVTVQVEGAFQPSDKSTVKGLSSRQAGGLILWKDSQNYLVFQRRASSGDEGKDTNQAVLEELVGGSKGVTHRQSAAEGPTFLRLERTKAKITAAFSKDGKDWKELKPVETTWAEGEIQVGVIAVNTSTGPHEVTFDEYSLKSR